MRIIPCFFVIIGENYWTIAVACLFEWFHVIIQSWYWYMYNVFIYIYIHYISRILKINAQNDRGHHWLCWNILPHVMFHGWSSHTQLSAVERREHRGRTFRWGHCHDLLAIWPKTTPKPSKKRRFHVSFSHILTYSQHNNLVFVRKYRGSHPLDWEALHSASFVGMTSWCV